MDSGEIFDFVTKAYELVDDPSTDSVISWKEDGKGFTVWHPAECCRNHFPRLLGITTFERFQILGFRKSESRGLLEFANDDFVRGRPELLDKIGKPCWGPTDADREIILRIKNCKAIEEQQVLLKEFKEKKRKERNLMTEAALIKSLDDLLKRMAREREEGGLSKDVEDQLQRNITGLWL